MSKYQYRLLEKQEAETMTKEHLAFMYNDAVETIWHLYNRIEVLTDENDKVWQAYDEISNYYLG